MLWNTEQTFGPNFTRRPRWCGAISPDARIGLEPGRKAKIGLVGSPSYGKTS